MATSFATVKLGSRVTKGADLPLTDHGSITLDRRIFARALKTAQKRKKPAF